MVNYTTQHEWEVTEVNTSHFNAISKQELLFWDVLFCQLFFSPLCPKRCLILQPAKHFSWWKKRVGGEKGHLPRMSLVIKMGACSVFYHLSVTQKVCGHSPSSLEVSCLTTDSGERAGGLPSGWRRLFFIFIFIFAKAAAVCNKPERAPWEPHNTQGSKGEYRARGRILVIQTCWIHTANFIAFWLQLSLPSQLLQQIKPMLSLKMSG